MRLPKPSIGHAIFALATLLIVLMTIVAGLNAYLSRQVGELIGTINRTYVPVYGMLARAHIRSLEQSLELRQAAIDRAAGRMAEAERHLAAEAAAGVAAEAELASARRVIADQAGRGEGVEDRVVLGRLDAQIEAAIRDRVSYGREKTALVEALKTGDGAAQAAALEKLDDVRAQQNERFEQARRESLGFTTGAVERTREDGSKVVRLTLITLGIAVLLGLLIALVVTRRVVGAIRRLVTATQAVENGRYDLDLPVTSQDEIGSLTRSFNLMLAELRLKERIRETFGRYIDPQVVADLIDRPELTASAGDRRVMTIAFADLRGFTRLSGEVTPTLLVTLLNRYFTDQTEEIRARRGVVDKFIGDAVMAFWGPPFVDAEAQARLACEAALAQMARFDLFRAALPDLLGIRSYLPDIGLRIGLATGEVVAGSVGSTTAMNYTVMGEAVNLASRLQGVNKLYGTSILVSAETARRAGPGLVLREIDTVTVPGRTDPLAVFELVAAADTVTPARRQLVDAYAAALARYRAGAWAEAADGFAHCLSLDPHDAPSRLMRERAAAFAEQPPQAGWTGAWAVTEK